MDFRHIISPSPVEIVYEVIIFGYLAQEIVSNICISPHSDVPM